MKAVIATVEKLKPKVLYLRGSYLNPFEVQYLAGLMDKFNVVLAHPGYHRYDLSSIQLPRIEIPCLDYLNGWIPRRIAGCTIPNPLKYLGYEEVLFGLERFTAGFDLVSVPEQSFYFTWQIAKKKKKSGYKMITMQDEVNPFWYLNIRPIVERASFVRQETDLFIARSERAKYALICEGSIPGKYGSSATVSIPLVSTRARATWSFAEHWALHPIDSSCYSWGALSGPKEFSFSRMPPDSFWRNPR
jgi:hypothetical protein